MKSIKINKKLNKKYTNKKSGGAYSNVDVNKNTPVNREAPVNGSAIVNPDTQLKRLNDVKGQLIHAFNASDLKRLKPKLLEEITRLSGITLKVRPQNHSQTRKNIIPSIEEEIDVFMHELDNKIIFSSQINDIREMLQTLKEKRLETMRETFGYSSLSDKLPTQTFDNDQFDELRQKIANKRRSNKMDGYLREILAHVEKKMNKDFKENDLNEKMEQAIKKAIDSLNMAIYYEEHPEKIPRNKFFFKKSSDYYFKKAADDAVIAAKAIDAAHKANEDNRHMVGGSSQEFNEATNEIEALVEKMSNKKVNMKICATIVCFKMIQHATDFISQSQDPVQNDKLNKIINTEIIDKDLKLNLKNDNETDLFNKMRDKAVADADKDLKKATEDLKKATDDVTKATDAEKAIAEAAKVVAEKKKDLAQKKLVLANATLNPTTDDPASQTTFNTASQAVATAEKAVTDAESGTHSAESRKGITKRFTNAARAARAYMSRKKIKIGINHSPSALASAPTIAASAQSSASAGQAVVAQAAAAEQQRAEAAAAEQQRAEADAAAATQAAIEQAAGPAPSALG